MTCPRAVFAVALLGLLTATAAAWAAPAGPFVPSAARVAARADRYLSARMRLGRFSGAVLIARDGRVILREGYGFADVERRIRYTPETAHEIGSVSKMFTAMAALRLRDAGKLDLAAPITRYLDDAPAAWSAITVNHLIHHTSGIPDYEEPLDLGSAKYMEFMSRPEATREIYENAKRESLDFAPGTEFHYSNTGYLVLARLIERAAGRSFTDVIREELLVPAGLAHTGCFGERARPAGLAAGYTHGGLAWDRMLAGVSLTDGHLEKVAALPLTPPAGDAGMYSTLDDLYRWSHAMEGHGAISAADVAEAFTPGLGRYGAGWIMDTFGGEPRMRHNGIMPGYLAELIRYPNAHVTIVLLSNLDTARLSRISRDLSAIVLGKPWDMPVQAHVTSLNAPQIERLEGLYRMPEGDTLRIANDPPMISAEIRGRFLAGLIPVSPTEAYMPLAEGRAKFEVGARNRARRVNLHYDGVDHVAERIASP